MTVRRFDQFDRGRSRGSRQFRLDRFRLQGLGLKRFAGNDKSAPHRRRFGLGRLLIAMTIARRTFRRHHFTFQHNLSDREIPFQFRENPSLTAEMRLLTYF